MTDIRYLRNMINGVPVLTAPAEIDITTAERLREVLLQATSRRYPMVVVDMTGTRFCDSAGLHTLLAAHKRVMTEGDELRLVIPADGAVRRVLTVTGLDRLMPCFPSLQEALAETAR